MYTAQTMGNIVALVLTVGIAAAEDSRIAVPEGVGVRTFSLAHGLPDGRGGVYAHDLDADGQFELLITSPGHVTAYRLDGSVLWDHAEAIRFFDTAHHPSAIAGELLKDGQPVVGFLTEDDRIVFLDGRSGKEIHALTGIGRPWAIAVANLRGTGDREILVQFSQTHVRAIAAADGRPLWDQQDYQGIEHSPLRQADLDGDGFDEVAGARLIDHDGTLISNWDLGDNYKSMDSLVIADVIPGLPLEVVLAEQRGSKSHTDMVSPKGLLWRALNPWNWEDPDKLAVGDFDPDRPGLEIFNRASGGDGTAKRGREEPFVEEIAPWVLDAQGQLITKYYINDHKPEWWTGHGLEEIHRIDWDGTGRDRIVGKERHKDGACAIVDPMTGKFLVVFPAEATRLYAADLFGDSREEILVLNKNGSAKIFENTSPHPRPNQPSPWTVQHYRRQKQNWNYYSP